jgi:protein SCO1/2
MLCTLVLNGMVESLQDLKLDMGKQFTVVNVSIDPHETPELAAAKKKTCLKRYGRKGAAAGWHFLTGAEPAVKQLADEVGFRYAYDPSIKQYAHPSGIIILTPEGKVARYFFGINYSPKELAAALKQARTNQTGSPIEQLILLCFHYSPVTGKYGNLIMTIVRGCGVATLVGLAGAIVLVSRRRQKINPTQSDVNHNRVSAAAGATALEEAEQ